jgi:hypothetical protein
MLKTSSSTEPIPISSSATVTQSYSSQCRPITIDPDEVVTAIAKTVAELTCGQDGTIRQQLIEQLMREIMDYDAEFRKDAETIAMSSDARH